MLHLLSDGSASADERGRALVHEGELPLGFGFALISADLDLKATRRRLRRVCCLRRRWRRRYRQARA